MDIEYRKAGINDVEELTQLRLMFLFEAGGEPDDEYTYAVNKEFFTDGIMSGEFISWIAVDDGRIIATSGISFYKLPPNKFSPTGLRSYISNMYTLPEYRNNGIATKLFALTVDEAKQRGCKSVLLNATDMGRPIYEKYGFKNANNEMHYIIE